jgi:hypothetical protein
MLLRMRALAIVFLIGCSGSDEGVAEPADTESAVETAATDETSAPIDSGTTDASDTSVTTDAPAETTSEASMETAPACGCTTYTMPVSVGTVGAPLVETSGLVASRKNAGVIYAHNDSGDTPPPRIFALSSKGAVLGQINVGGATFVDWEDIALGPCASGTCIFIGDVGDNGMARTNDAVYEIPEPTLDGKPFTTQTIASKKYPFTYPDGKWNCEALLVHPTTGEVFVVTKNAAIDGGVYKFPKLEAGVPVVLEKVGSASGTKGALVTGGDVSPCGDRVMLRTYDSLLEYSGKTVAAALATTPVKVPVAKEGQGEAVAYRFDGSGYFTASEGASAPLYATSCK